MAQGFHKSFKGVQSCQICQCMDHLADKPCPLLYSKCKIPGCTGIRKIMEAHTEANNGRKFLKCQYVSCTGFQWLDEAIIESRGLVGSSSSSNKPFGLDGCFHCGRVGHWKKDCPLIGTCCKKCGGVVTLKVSGKKESEGRRYLKCGSCEKFEWFIPEENQIGNVKMTLEGSLEDFCNMFKNKMM